MAITTAVASAKISAQKPGAVFAGAKQLEVDDYTVRTLWNRIMREGLEPVLAAYFSAPAPLQVSASPRVEFASDVFCVLYCDCYCGCD
jgi:hypothetical protein